MTALITLTLFGFSGVEKLWAFAQMALARAQLTQIPGLRFWKLLGSGHGGGFSLRPNWARYGLLTVWENDGALQGFFNNCSLMRNYRRHADEIWTVRLLPIATHGVWSGINPFLPLEKVERKGPIAILTRATIHFSRLREFWGTVPETSQALDNTEGLLASIGIGEAPFIRQATFSLWRSVSDMEKFAFQNAAHREAMRRTRAEYWYREELFARFVPMASEGTWNGRDPLAGLL